MTMIADPPADLVALWMMSYHSARDDRLVRSEAMTYANNFVRGIRSTRFSKADVEETVEAMTAAEGMLP